MDWKIWFEHFVNGRKVGAGVWHQSYKRRGNAIRRAQKQFDRVIKCSNQTITYKWVVSQTNPWASRS